MMRIYLATKYSDKQFMRLVRSELRKIGHTVISSWLDERHEANVQIDDVPNEKLASYADIDITEILNADAFVLFQSAAAPNIRGGASVEHGIAIGAREAGSDINIVIVGDRINVFDFYSDTLILSDVDELLRWAQDVKDDEKAIEGTWPPVTKELEKCWCGKELAILGNPDFAGDYETCTMHYECPVHGQFYEKPRGIGISGKARSGKDTLAKMLQKELGWPVVHFADELKREWFSVAHTDKYAMGVDDVVAEVNRMKVEDPTVRKKLIDYGQWRRGQDPNYWVERVGVDLTHIIADVRFVNEFEYLRKNGYMLIRVNCSNDVLAARGCPPIDDESEISLDNVTSFDVYIENDSPLIELEYNAKRIAFQILHPQAGGMNETK